MNHHDAVPRGRLARLRALAGRAARFMCRRPWLSATGLFVAGIIFWGGFNTALEVTNTEAFCIACHEMRDNVYQEYRQTVHFSNPTGVRATCPDCHVPRVWIYKVGRKIAATNELYHKLIGSIDTREKFLARRLHLAEHVWRIMKGNDSRECRNCHSFKSMALAKQSSLAAEKHRKSVQAGLTCIDCHMGIAHRIAEDFDRDGRIHEAFRKNGRDCSDCHKGMARAPD